MSEIEKMYENCGIYPDCRARECGLDYCANSSACGYAVYPDFTAEKQLELFKLLIRHYKTEIYCRYVNDKYKLIMYTEDCYTSDIDSFENALASIVCNVWGLLSEEEKQQVKGILE